ncbi:sigma-70 family RNA polymerase sigma factor [soil metagenome]
MTDTLPEAAELPTTELSFAEARDRYAPLVFAFVARRIRPVEEAEDIVAAVFVDAYRGWSRKRGEPRLWLLGIARRKVADALRKRRQPWPLREEDAQGNAMQEFVTQAQADHAAALVAKLPPDERDALLLQVLEELPIEEIAAILGRSLKATNSLLGRARTRVRRLAAQTGEFQ